jgi:hypothetical protein
MTLIFTHHYYPRIGINRYLSSVERIYIEGAPTRRLAIVDPRPID